MAEQVAWVVNGQPHDSCFLMVARLLKPLGNLLYSSVKYFAASEVQERSRDRTWLAKINNAFKCSIGNEGMRLRGTTPRRRHRRFRSLLDEFHEVLRRTLRIRL